MSNNSNNNENDNNNNNQKPALFAIPQSKRGINAVQINQAREMVKIHTQARLPINKRDQQSQSQPQVPKPAGFNNVSIPNHESKCNNPQCDHCGQIIIPSPRSSFPIQDKPSICINDWEIYTIKKPILNSVELDNLESRFDFPLPEMIFGNNLVRIINKESKEEIHFNALDALDSLDSECEFKVSYHEEWLKSRKSQKSKIKSETLNKKDLSEFTENLDIVKPFDWTYSPNYKGTLTNLVLREKQGLEIPISKLTQPDPILFFDESILFEDELADNGISIFSTKIRVMPTCLLLLNRFFLRIDNVIFRIRDTRIFIDFGTNELIREYKEQELEYDKLLKKCINCINSNDPKKLLRDSNWVSQNIPVIKRIIESNK
ncbi:unnamed protein product [Candida verbasci]|uniref:Type 2A phosphatase activator TIP41 n=1 Tax=Candida verbasci TaxID=1227364 RepID=A0A9W4TWW1_9ASCO|nr:unnamed protein product [Candida verbasci]